MTAICQSISSNVTHAAVGDDNKTLCGITFRPSYWTINDGEPNCLRCQGLLVKAKSEIDMSYMINTCHATISFLARMQDECILTAQDWVDISFCEQMNLEALRQLGHLRVYHPVVSPNPNLLANQAPKLLATLVSIANGATPAPDIARDIIRDALGITLPVGNDKEE